MLSSPVPAFLLLSTVLFNQNIKLKKLLSSEGRIQDFWKGVHMYTGVGVCFADFISFFLKGTATLMISMSYQKELFES